MGPASELVLPASVNSPSLYQQSLCTGNLVPQRPEAGTRRPGKLCAQAPFSFAGMGVVIDVTQEDYRPGERPENWIP